MRQKIKYILAFFLLAMGVGLILYPAVADWWNQNHHSDARVSYMEAVEKADCDALRKEAEEYNQKLLQKRNRWYMTEDEKEEYDDLLNVAGNGILGHISIPKIDVSLPIYQGNEKYIKKGYLVHYEGTSIPVGGETTHSVIAGHTGMPSAKLFTDLDQMEVGDVFTLQVLDETLNYEVDQIVVVEPDEIEYLEIEEGKDYCTLVTCTPYGINSHRLLVRGERVED